MATAYHGALSAPFLWDDRQLILDDVIETNSPLIDHVLQPFWRSGVAQTEVRSFFRPLTTLSFALDAAWSGENPVGFHLTNLVLHVAVIGGLYWLSRRLGARAAPALLASLAFGLAPRLTESVTWISGRTDVLAALFGTFALCLHPFRVLDAAPSRPWLRRTVAALLLVLGIAAKEVAVAFAVVIVADEYLCWRRGTGQSAQLLRRVSPLVLGLVGYLALRLSVIGLTKPDSPEFASQPLTVLEVIGRYVAMLVDFARPRSLIGDAGTPDLLHAALGGVFLVVLIGAALLRRQRKRAESTQAASVPAGITLGLMLTFAAIAPVLHMAPLPVQVVAADRFLYVPLLGLALAAATAGSRLERQHGRRAAALALLLCGASLVATVIRNRDYRSELAFWLEAVRTTPEYNPLPIHELAGVYYRANDFQSALGLYSRAAERKLARVQRNPRVLAEIGNDLSGALSGVGRYSDALLISERLVDPTRATPREVFNVALLHLHRGDFARARQLTNQALSLFPRYTAARTVLASLPELQKQREELPLLKGIDQHVAKARYYDRLGARLEAQLAYLELLESRPGAALADEALAFLALRGDPKAVASAANRFTSADPRLRAALDARLQQDADLRAAAPLVSPFMAPFDPQRLGL